MLPDMEALLRQPTEGSLLRAADIDRQRVQIRGWLASQP
jgi:hypothetical protein